MHAAGPGRVRASLVFLRSPLIAAAVIAGFVLWAHLGSNRPVFTSHVSFEPGWKDFRAAYSVDDFGEDGHFVRAAQNGFNVFFLTHKYAGRFTRKLVTDRINACASCHSPN